MAIDMGVLKLAQKDLAIAQEACIAAFDAFCEGFWDRLDRFTQEAAHEGLQGAWLDAFDDLEGGTAQKVTAGLNGYKLVAVARPEAYPVGPTPPLVFQAKIWIYPDETRNVLPDAVVVLERGADGHYSYFLHWLAGKAADAEEPTAGDRIGLIQGLEGVEAVHGGAAADTLIGFYYQLISCWGEEPSYGEWEDDEVAIVLGP